MFLGLSPIMAEEAGTAPVNTDEPTSFTELMYMMLEPTPTAVIRPTMEIVDNAYVTSPTIPYIPELEESVLDWIGAVTTKVIQLPEDLTSRWPGQCVVWVRHYANVDYAGNAIAWTQYVNSDTPEVGAIVVLSLSNWGHVGIVTKIENGFITYRSRNLLGRWIVSDATIPVDDPTILGYIIK